MSAGPTPPKKPPHRAAEADAREAERRERLAAALRDNLRRRKAVRAPRPDKPDPEQ